MKYNKYKVAPQFHRIPHFNKDISNMTHDDIISDSIVGLPLNCWYQEKLDGSSMGISWLNDGPILRNREHILKKGYSKIKTPAKKQFTSAWNWLHEHKEDIEFVSEMCYSPITIFGEWLFAKHSIYYDKLPDVFIAYDIWSVEDNSYLSPDVVETLLSQTDIKYIKPYKTIFSSIEEIIKTSELPSDYRNGIREGIVIKEANGRLCNNVYKIVNKKFERRSDFNSELIKNTILR